MRKLVLEHAETRWLALRLDNDVREILDTLRVVQATQGEQTAVLHVHTAVLNEHTAVLNEHSELLQEHSIKLLEHTARFDSVDMQLRSLTLMVGDVLRRLPEPEETDVD